jgi:hypothetical protein
MRRSKMMASRNEVILKRIAICMEKGKINTQSLHSPDMREQVGADELVRLALEEGISTAEILEQGLVQEWSISNPIFYPVISGIRVES